MSRHAGWRTCSMIGVIVAAAVGCAITCAHAQPAPGAASRATGAVGALLGPRPAPAPRPLPLPGTPLLPPIIPEAQVWWPASGDPLAVTDGLVNFIAYVQQVLNGLTAWVTSAEQTVRDAVVQIVWQAPGYLPQGVDLSGLVGQILALPGDLRQTLSSLLAAWQAPVAPGTLPAAHQAYVSASPALAHEAVGIATTVAAVATDSVREDAAIQATSEAADAASTDQRLSAAALGASQVGGALVQGAAQIPSSRAGIELLVAGMGAGMQQQADLDTALGDRLTLLVQQTAAVSQQIGALAQTAGTLAAWDAERDRRDLDARVGLMDAVRAGGQAFAQLLAGAGESSSAELPLEPLY